MTIQSDSWSDGKCYLRNTEKIDAPIEAWMWNFRFSVKTTELAQIFAAVDVEVKTATFNVNTTVADLSSCF